MKRMISFVCLVAILVVAVTGIQPASAQSTMVDLGVTGRHWTDASDVNNRGQVVGNTWVAFLVSHGFVWTEQDGMVDLGTLGGPQSYAQCINDRGQVVGTSTTASGESHFFLWTEQDGMVDLGTLGVGWGEATDINNLGQVVGNGYGASGAVHAFLWTQRGVPVDLGTLGGPESRAEAINDRGQVVGYSWTTSGEIHPFLWTDEDGMADLGTLGGFWTEAHAINDSGQVVGWGFTASGATHAFLWTEENGMMDLGPLLGIPSEAFDINDRGQVVGWAFPPSTAGVFEAPTVGYMGYQHRQGRHRGIDIWKNEPNDPGTPPGPDVIAAYDGTVVAIYGENRNTGSWYHTTPADPAASIIAIRHEGVTGAPTTIYTLYLHLANDNGSRSYVKPELYEGMPVVKGQVIAQQGNWRYHGYADVITHLHFEVNTVYTCANCSNIDPSPYLGFDVNYANVRQPGHIQYGDPFPPISPAEPRPFLWTEKDGVTYLGTLGGPNNAALGINDRGQVVGYSETTSGEFHAFLWTSR